MTGRKPGPNREAGGGSEPFGGSSPPIDRPSGRPDNGGGRGGFDPETTALAGLSLPWNQSGRPFFNDAGELLENLFAQLGQLTEAADLIKVLERLLGPQAFSLGVVYGAGQSFVVSIRDLLSLVKTLVLADLYDATRRNPAWTLTQPGGIARYLTAQTLNEYFGAELEQAAKDRAELIAEMRAIFSHPVEFLGKVGDEYAEKFKRFIALSGDPSLASQFQAGCIFGELLLEVLGLLAAAGAAAKMASKIPRLARLAESLRGKFIKRAKVGGGPAGELAGAPPPEVGAKRATAAGPKEGKAPVEAEAAPAAATPKTNTVTWTRDESGRLVRAEGTLRQTHSGAARSSAEVGAQKKVGKLGIEGDEGGHAVGHRFVLDQGEKNMFPQNGNFNKSAYKTMENEWADWIDSGAEVRFKTEFEGTGARPGSVFVDYDVVDPATGKVIYQNSVEFANQAGQVFERVPAKDMKAMIK